MASQNVEAFRALHEAFNRRDFDGVVSRMAEGFTYRDQARNVTFTGRNGFKEFMQGWAGAFSNAAVTDPSYLDAGDTVIAQFMGQGVNDGAFGPLPETGREIDVPFPHRRPAEPWLQLEPDPEPGPAHLRGPVRR